MSTIHNANVEPFLDNYVRITEDGNTRITENLNRRITDDIKINQGLSGLYANATYLPFTSRAFIKVNGIWKQFFPFANYLDIWKTPLKMYNKTNDFWKRIY